MPRISFSMNKAIRERMEQIRIQAGHTTLTGMIRSAFASYEMLVREEAEGGRVLLEDKDGNIRQLLVRGE